MRASFQSGRQCQGSLNADSLAASALPLCAGSIDLQGGASCLPLRWGIPSVSHSQTSCEATAAIIAYQDLLQSTACKRSFLELWSLVNTQTIFFLCQEHNLFKSSGNSNQNKQNKPNQNKIFTTWIPTEKLVTPDPTCWDSSRMSVAGQTFTGCSHQVGNATSSLSDQSSQSQKPQSLQLKVNLLPFRTTFLCVGVIAMAASACCS